MNTPQVTNNNNLNMHIVQRDQQYINANNIDNIDSLRRNLFMNDDDINDDNNAQHIYNTPVRKNKMAKCPSLKRNNSKRRLHLNGKSVKTILFPTFADIINERNLYVTPNQQISVVFNIHKKNKNNNIDNIDDLNELKRKLF